MEPEIPDFDPLTGEITELLCGCIIVEMPQEQLVFVDMDWCGSAHFKVWATFDDEGFQ